MNDADLLKIYRDGNKNYAFNLIVEKYKTQLYWQIRRMVISHDDADDVLQNSLIKVWESLDTFREESKLFTWLYRIVTNESLTFLKKKRNKYIIPLVNVERQLVNNLRTDEYFTGDEIERKLQKAILQLPEKQRIVFNMRYYDEISYEEMSEILNTSEGALKASFHHALKKIEKYLSGD